MEDKAMTDDEFDFLDEVYFVTPYKEIQSSLGWEDGRMISCIAQLVHKGWLRCYAGADKELLSQEVHPSAYITYSYLASKQGLLAHNGH
jgi:hypothetical protein